MCFLEFSLFAISFLAGGSPLAMPAPLHIIGIVKSADGTPIEKVSVYENSQRSAKEIVTDSDGKFSLENAGSVLHFSKGGFQPQVVILKPGDKEIEITMTTEDGLLLPVCGPGKQTSKEIRPGKFGLRFSIPKQEKLTVKGGKWDVDYVKYVILSDIGHDYLEMWFGPYAMNLNPDDEVFIKSTEFKQRSLDLDDDARRIVQTVGYDTVGKYPNGKIWRQTAMIAEGGARYLADSPEEASVFDRIVDSLCYAPYPAH